MIIVFIVEEEVIRKALENLVLWDEPEPRPSRPPVRIGLDSPPVRCGNTASEGKRRIFMESTCSA